MDGMLSHLEKLLEAKNIFVRNRKQMRTRALGILMYHYGLSLRKCRSILSDFEDISHESIRKWYHKTYTLFTVGKCYRETVAVDETKVKINGRLYILWAGIDVKTWEVLVVWVTKGRASIDARPFVTHMPSTSQLPISIAAQTIYNLPLIFSFVSSTAMISLYAVCIVKMVSTL